MNDTAHPATPGTAKQRSAARPKVPAFARYRGTSVWRKDRNRVRAYAEFLAKTKNAGTTNATPSV